MTTQAQTAYLHCLRMSLALAHAYKREQEEKLFAVEEEELVEDGESHGD